MPHGTIHYEAFFRRTKTSGWSLQGAFHDRDQAIHAVKELMSTGGAIGVRVYKETFKEDTGDFLSLKVFEDGDVKEKKVKGDDGPSLPCFKPDDLYSFHGKRTIARLLRDALTRWRITASELMHHAGHIERLELTGTVLQHAVQKAAVKHAGTTGEPVQQIVRQLNELVSRAIERVVLDQRNNRLPVIGPGGFGALCAKLVDSSTPDYLLNAAIARHIEGAKSWGEKLNCVIELMADLPGDGPARTLGLKTIDSLVGEMLEGNAALADLLGEQADLGAALLKMADLFLGRIAEDGEERPGVRALCREFSRGNLVNARAAIAHRALQEIKGVRRLRPDSLDEEVKLIRMLATRMVMGEGSLVTHEEIMEAFIARSKHLVMPATIDRYLEGLRRPEEKLDKLFTLEENVLGAGNKRELVSYLNGILSSPRTETYFIESAEPAASRLQTLAALYKRASRSGLQELNKRQVCEAIEALALKLDAKAAILEGVVRGATTPLEAAERLLQLVVAGGVPDGAMGELARNRVRDLMRMPAFRGVLAGAGKERVEAFSALLAKAGIEATGGKAQSAA